jgi:hypothetical protein
MANFIDQILYGMNPTSGAFTSPIAQGIMPGEQAGIPSPQQPQQPQQGLSGKLDSFLGQPGGMFLMNLLAQEGRSLTPGPSPIGAFARAGIMTRNQLSAQDKMEMDRQLIESRIGLNKARALQGGNPGGQNVAKTFPGENGNMWVIRRDGSTSDTGVAYDPKLQFRELADGTVVPLSTRTGQSQGGGISPEQAAQSTVQAQVNTEQAQAVTELPQATGKAERLLSQLDELESHPGMKGAVGVKGITSGFGLFDEPVAGSDEAGFVARVEQVGGSVFLEAFQELKGGGHITEIEGQKAEQAVARIRNRDQRETEYKSAIMELRDIINRGLERKRRAAAGDFSGTSEFEGFSIATD